ncbi:MAG: hypothetical protein K2Y18_04570 [Alphaproteobacteria bacterium]|jgi:hypothetical protein|nr:hypothetical protein [Alphaproteobacteria bacterium]
MNIIKTIPLSFYMSLISVTTTMAADETHHAMNDPAIVSFLRSSSMNGLQPNPSEGSEQIPGCACTDKQTVRGLQKDLFASKAENLDMKMEYETRLEGQRELISQQFYVTFQSQALIVQQEAIIDSLQKQNSELSLELATVKKNSQETNGTLCRVLNQKNEDLRRIDDLLKEAPGIDPALLAQIMNIIRGESQE